MFRDFLQSHGYGSRDVVGQLKTYKPMGSCDAVYTHLCMWIHTYQAEAEGHNHHPLYLYS